MARFRYRDEDPSFGSLIGSMTLGALAGFAVGVIIAQRVGGISGLTARVRDRLRDVGGRLSRGRDEESDQVIEGEEYGDPEAALEERVLEAFRNDPILAERAIDIGAVGDGIIELSGWVNSDGEADHAVIIARGVPGVDTVVNRLAVGEEEQLLEETTRRFEGGDPALRESRWEGRRVGTGRRRQGTSRDPDRHADPKVQLEDRWQNEEDAVRNAADETEGIAERRRSSRRPARGDRTGGSPVAPTGVPKADHVAEPTEISPEQQGD